MPPAGTVQPASIGYHFAGSQTSFASYYGIEGTLQVQNPDLSQSGVNAFAAEWYLLTPDYNLRLQAGWVEEEWHGDVRRVFSENNVPGYAGRKWFEQFPLVDGGEYTFEVGTSFQGTTWVSAIWWSEQWNLLEAIPADARLLVMQQALEVYTSSGVHPSVAAMTNYGSTLYDSNWSPQLWDTSITTSWRADAPYCLDWLAMYHHWRTRYCP
jgi:hypothetical protein